jgi:hypothetical protein
MIASTPSDASPDSFRLPCILDGIMVCSASFRPSEFESWYEHSLSHYEDSSPPNHALCIFCHTVFDSIPPSTCWRDRMRHIANHFKSGCTMKRSRPDFRVIKDMWQKGLISERTYEKLFQHTEKPPCDGLQHHDYVPKEIKKKHNATYDRKNRIIVTERRREPSSTAVSKKKLKSESRASSSGY